MSSSNSVDPKHSASGQIRAIVIDRDHAGLAAMKQSLLSTDLVEIVAETTSYTLAIPLVERHAPNFVFVSIGEDVTSAGELISNIRRKSGSARIVAVGSRQESTDILCCFRSGAEEFLVKPLHEDQLAVVLENLKDRRPVAAEAQEPRGQIIAFWGTRGGCGTTTIACNIAYTLAKEAPTVLVDFHFDQGDLAVHLDLRPTYSLSDVNESVEQLDETLIESITTKHSSGLRLLLQLVDSQPSRLNDETIVRILRILERQYAYVILDIGHDNSVANAIVNHTNAFFLVTTQNVPSLYLAAQKLRLLDVCGYERDRSSIIVNEFVKRATVSLDRVAKAVGKTRIVCIRKDEDLVLSAMNQGVPLREISRRGKATKDIEHLAGMIQSKEEIPAVAVKEKGSAARNGTLEKTTWQESISLSTAGK